jgi:hypothetical protein
MNGRGPFAARTRRPPAAWALATLLVGFLDGLAAVIVVGATAGVGPERIFQSIAAGALGRDALGGGLTPAFIGVGLHFVIAGIVTAIYMVASRWLVLLRRHPLVCGPLYGIGVYVVMNLVVLPLSALAAPARLTLAAAATGVPIHVLCVGLPVAIVASRVLWKVEDAS